MTKTTSQEALAYHRMGRPGKISVAPTKPLVSQRDLSLAYSPGVAAPVLEIERDPELAYEYTAKGNLVAVISNGSAILGLGNRGGLASKPVMEGKAVLFKHFADIDVFDIELDAPEPDTLIAVVKSLAPTFGGINLEDIKAPDCFYIEEQLKESLDIPVFHDDQHGTAIIASAGLLNGLELVGKRIEDIRLVISGAGAAAISCANLAIKLGVRPDHLLMVDSRGVIHQQREAGMNPYKRRFAADTAARSLGDALQGADAFYGLSVADILTPDMVQSMASDPLIFAMANPDPEIKYDLAKATRPDAIVATGRSDFPNQINNVLGFPYIFRGALDVRARSINDEMKIAAAHALAGLAKEDVPDSVLRAYDLESLKYGPEYLIPKPFDRRVLLWVAPAVARTAIETGLARLDIDLDRYADQLALRQSKDAEVRRYIKNKARSVRPGKRIVFTEGKEPAIIRAAAQVHQDGIAEPILVGNPAAIRETISELALDYDPVIVDPADFPAVQSYVEALYSLRRRKGVSYQEATKRLRSSTRIFGLMMVRQGDADALVAGLTYEYPDVLRPALRIHHTRPGVRRVSAANIMISGQRVYLLADVAVNVDPDPEEIAEIAALSADFFRQLEMEPRIAMLSFSNFGSMPAVQSKKMCQAADILRQQRPDLHVDGEMQADTAVSAHIVEARYPFSRVKDANILIFPNLDSANIAAKLLDQLGDAQLIGPILLGMGAPIHILDRTSDVDDIVNMAAVAVMDAISRENQ